MPSLAKRLAVAAVLMAAAAVGAAATLDTQASAGSVLTGSITRSSSLGECENEFSCWICDGPVDLDQVTVTVSADTTSSVDAVKLSAGCTGRIGKITILTSSGDGLKVSSGAHDIDIGGGTIACAGRFGAVHQDGIQAMGGTDITFRGVRVACATANHSAFFVNRGGLAADEVPTRILFVRGYLGSTGTTVDLGTSKRSGVRNSTVCPSTRIGVPISIPAQPSGGGPAAVAPVDQYNTFPAVC